MIVPSGVSAILLLRLAASFAIAASSKGPSREGLLGIPASFHSPNLGSQFVALNWQTHHLEALDRACGIGGNAGVEGRVSMPTCHAELQCSSPYVGLPSEKRFFKFSRFRLTFASNTCTIICMSSSSTPAIEMALNEAVGRVNVAHAELVAVIVEVLDSGCWNGHGIRSPEHWVTWKTGVSATRARDLVLIARRTVELPVTAEVFRSGLLSADQVAVISRETPAEFDETVCELAKSSTVPQLQSVLRSYPWHKSTKPAKTDKPAEESNDGQVQPETGTKPEPAPTPDPEPEDRVYTRHDENSRFHLHAELGSLEGAEIEAALNEAKDALYRAGNHNVTWAEALLEVCRRSLNNSGSTSRADNFRVYLHVNGDRAWINGGPKLPASVRSRILCDSSIHPYLITGGKPVSVGRVTRVIPAHTRRAVLDRDSTCRYPGCTARKLRYITSFIGNTVDQRTLTILRGCARFTIIDIMTAPIP